MATSFFGRLLVERWGSVSLPLEYCRSSWTALTNRMWWKWCSAFSCPSAWLTATSCLLECFFLEPSHHCMRKLKQPNGDATGKRTETTTCQLPWLSSQLIASTNLPTRWRSHLRGASPRLNWTVPMSATWDEDKLPRWVLHKFLIRKIVNNIEWYFF